MTERARRSFRDSFETRHQCGLCGTVEIDQALPAADRRRMAEAAYRAHMTRLSHRRDIMRGRAAAAADAALEAEAELGRLDDAV